jgi:hypothetical protein
MPSPMQGRRPSMFFVSIASSNFWTISRSWTCWSKNAGLIENCLLDVPTPFQNHSGSFGWCSNESGERPDRRSCRISTETIGWNGGDSEPRTSPKRGSLLMRSGLGLPFLWVATVCLVGICLYPLSPAISDFLMRDRANYVREV